MCTCLLSLRSVAKILVPAGVALTFRHIMIAHVSTYRAITPGTIGYVILFNDQASTGFFLRIDCVSVWLGGRRGEERDWRVGTERVRQNKREGGGWQIGGRLIKVRSREIKGGGG